MASIDLSTFIKAHQEYIHFEMTRNLRALPFTPYLDFVLNSDQGRRDLKKWVDFTTTLLDRDPNEFFLFQKEVGFRRAVQGFRLEDVFIVYLTFNEIIWQLIRSARRGSEPITFDEYKDFRDFYEILFQGYTHVAVSIISTQEDRISEKVTLLKNLYDFTKDIITTRELEDAIQLILRSVKTLFNIEDIYFAHKTTNDRIKCHSYSSKSAKNEISKLAIESFKNGSVLYLSDGDTIEHDINSFRIKKAVSIPITVHKICYGVLVLYDSRNGFQFYEKELAELFQYFYIIAVSLENIYMLEKIQDSRRELQLITSKVITIREEEQKRLAADIHDTLAQSLAGISYKMQYCKELAKKNPELLIESLDNLVNTVNDTVNKTKLLISSLRPPLFDTMGLIPALKRYIQHFTDRTKIEVDAKLPDSINLAGDKGICIFRVTQEALTNIYKHAETNKAKVELIIDQKDICLEICDKGKGCNFSEKGVSRVKSNKLGLIYMKERIESVGGTRSVESEKNKGFCITVRIPLSEEDSLK